MKGLPLIRLDVRTRAFACATVCGFAGCAGTPSTLQLVDHRTTGEIRRFRETFDESFFALDAAGNIELVLRRHQAASGATPPITQIVIVRGLWKCIPGTTIANRSQINGSVSYAVISGRSATLFEGAGAFLCDIGGDGKSLRGTLDGAALQPVRNIGGGEAIFDRAVVAGSVHARRDALQTRRIINDLERMMNPRKRS